MIIICKIFYVLFVLSFIGAWVYFCKYSEYYKNVNIFAGFVLAFVWTAAITSVLLIITISGLKLFLY
jgi:hypothetical protein